MTVADMRQLAVTTASAHRIDPTLVQAVCHHESGWNPWATRYEQGFFDRYVSEVRMPTVQTFGICSSVTERRLRATSFGLMQIMGQVARESGYKAVFLTQLCDPYPGLEYGCIKLARCLKANNNDPRGALLMFNGGADSGYPDKVLAHLKEYS